MSAPFTTNAWEHSPPFEPLEPSGVGSPCSDKAASPVAADAKAHCSGGGLPGATGTEVRAAHGAEHSADATAAAGTPAAPDAAAAAAAATAGVVVAAPSPKGAKSGGGAVVVASPLPSIFPGLYEDVEYPLRTLYAPPQPPGDLPPRVKRPVRPGPVYANDITSAGERHHRAQREVSRMWRGVLCRRRLRQARMLDELVNHRARRIQCWWRCLQARWRRRQLHAIREEWAKERTAQYVADCVANTTNIIYWQQCRFDAAAVLIQRMVRWYLREKERFACEARGLPESEWPPALEQPPTHTHRPYFPWRRRRHHAGDGVSIAGGALDADELHTAGGVGVHSRTLLRFRELRPPVPPPTQEEVETVNAKMRERNEQRALALATPEAVSRAAWKTEGMQHEDLDFNAGVVQRAYRSKQAPIKVRTRQVTEDYFNKTARIIARTFRMYVLIKRMRNRRAKLEAQVRTRTARRNAERVEALKVAAVWQRDLMDAAATCIQRCWHWYRYQQQQQQHLTAPASHATRDVAPPPYGLINAHIQREQALRWAAMSLMEQHELTKRRRAYHRFTPAKTTVLECTGRFNAVASDEL
ncbi:hypothetical protein NESM_000496000 [Novymonas esmeraldas]|uniref:Uncharacterized protein n=1 Tax=Novymonas esmeraldas TaxID=1808958 RepID=A0AAW0ENN1_9TRYP